MIDVTDDEEVTETTTEETTQSTTVTEETTETTTVTENTTVATTVAEPSDMIVKTVRTDLQKAIGTYSLGSYETAGKFKATAIKQTTDNWTSMATTTIDKRYVSVSKVFYTRVSACYRTIDSIYTSKYYSQRLSDLHTTMTNYKKEANELIDEFFKTRDIQELNDISNRLVQFTSDMRTNMKVLYDNT